MKKTIGFIGGGRITKIFLKAFQNYGIEFEKVLVFDPSTEALDTLKSVYSNFESLAAPENVARAEILVLAVHPPMMGEILQKISQEVSSDTLILSLAPKVTIQKIAASLNSTNVVRMIPNATTFVNKGYNPVSFHPEFSDSEKSVFFDLVKSFGNNFEVEESKLEGYAIVSAMLPTYFWFQWQEMEKISVETGLSPEESLEVIGDTLQQSIDIFYHSALSHEEVIDLIPVKPIAENEEEIKTILSTKLLGLYRKIKP